MGAGCLSDGVLHGSLAGTTTSVSHPAPHRQQLCVDAVRQRQRQCLEAEAHLLGRIDGAGHADAVSCLFPPERAAREASFWRDFRLRETHVRGHRPSDPAARGSKPAKGSPSKGCLLVTSTLWGKTNPPSISLLQNRQQTTPRLPGRPCPPPSASQSFAGRAGCGRRRGPSRAGSCRLQGTSCTQRFSVGHADLSPGKRCRPVRQLQASRGSSVRQEISPNNSSTMPVHRVKHKHRTAQLTSR